MGNVGGSSKVKRGKRDGVGGNEEGEGGLGLPARDGGWGPDGWALAKGYVSANPCQGDMHTPEVAH